MTQATTPPHGGPLTRADLTRYLLGHSAFQYLNAGCELGVFTALAEQPLTREALGARLGLAPQAERCLLFGLESLDLIVRDGDRLANSPAIAGLFDAGEWPVFAATVRFEARIVYPGQTDFVPALRAGAHVGVRRIDGEGRTLYEKLATNPELRDVFYDYMRAWSEMAAPLLLDTLDVGDATRLLDVGGGDGTNAIALLQRHPQLSATLVDLPQHADLPRGRFADAGLAERAEVVGQDIWSGELPGGCDLALLAHQTVIWSEAANTELLTRVCRALTPGGRVAIFCSLSDDDGRGPFFSAMIAQYFLAVAAGEGMLYSAADYRRMLEAAGFAEVVATRCDGWTPHGIVLGRKPR